MGPIVGTWLPAATKQAILLVIATSQDQGVSARRSCAILVIAHIVAMARSEEYVDLSHRILAITAGEKGLFFASFSTVYRIFKARDLMGARGPGGRHNGHSLVPQAPVQPTRAISAPRSTTCPVTTSRVDACPYNVVIPLP